MGSLQARLQTSQLAETAIAVIAKLRLLSQEGLRKMVQGKADYQAAPHLNSKDGDSGVELGKKESKSLSSFTHTTSGLTGLLVLPASSVSIMTKILTSWIWLVGSVWNVLRPTIFLKYARGQHKNYALHRTTWLNGLRGLAAVSVVFSHARTYVSYPWPCEWGRGWTSANPRLLELPIIRLFYGGPIGLFFVISGYAISYRALRMAGNGEFHKVYDTVVSQLFRRGIRLYIPCAVIALWSVFAHHLELFFGPDIKIDARAETLGSTIRWWSNGMIYGMNPFQPNFKNPWQNPLAEINMAFWTIPIEYRGSLLVFGLLLLLARVPRSRRLTFMVSYALYLVYIGQWDYFLFVSGMMCCELHNMNTDRPIHLALTETDVRTQPESPSPKRKAWHTIALFACLYVMSQPEIEDGNGDAPFYDTLDYWSPESWKSNRFWPCMASVAFLYLVEFTGITKAFFESTVMQYLGEISFSMYLLHPSFLTIIARRFHSMVFGWTAGLGGFWIKEILCQTTLAIMFLPILFWAADISTRHIDYASVMAGKWCENKFYGYKR